MIDSTRDEGVKRSESGSYLEYGNGLASGNYRKSLSSLLDFISENEREFSTLERIDMLDRMGEVYYLLGDKGLAHFFYRAGIDAGPKSLYPKYRYAKFIGFRLEDMSMALKLCSEIVSLLDTHNFSEDFFEADWYRQRVRELIEDLENKPDPS